MESIQTVSVVADNWQQLLTAVVFVATINAVHISVTSLVWWDALCIGTLELITGTGCVYKQNTKQFYTEHCGVGPKIFIHVARSTSNYYLKY